MFKVLKSDDIDNADGVKSRVSQRSHCREMI